MDTAFLPTPTTRPSASHRLGMIPDNRPLTRHEKLIQQTRKWVAISFFEPMLKQMRQSPFHSSLMDGGPEGAAFESMYDERLAERMASDSTDSLVQSMVRKIEGSKAYALQAAASQKDSAVDSEREGADRVRASGASAMSNIGAGHVSLHY